MLPSRSGILVEVKTRRFSQRITLIPHIPTLLSCIPTLISRIPTPIPRIPTLIPRVTIIPLIPFANSSFRLLQIALRSTKKFQKKRPFAFGKVAAQKPTILNSIEKGWQHKRSSVAVKFTYHLSV